MNLWSDYLDARPDKQNGRPAGEEWMLAVLAPAERLLKFDGWVCRQLEQRLRWPADAARKVKLREQCRARLEKITLELWRRGWQLDGAKLSKHIIAALDDVAAAQAAGRVKEFWPFFCKVVDTYVGLHAEEIQREAKARPSTQNAGDVIKNTLGSMLTPADTIPALIARRRSEINEERDEKLRTKLTKARKETHDDGQASLF